MKSIVRVTGNYPEEKSSNCPYQSKTRGRTQWPVDVPSRLCALQLVAFLSTIWARIWRSFLVQVGSMSNVISHDHVMQFRPMVLWCVVAKHIEFQR